MKITEIGPIDPNTDIAPQDADAPGTEQAGTQLATFAQTQQAAALLSKELPNGEVHAKNTSDSQREVGKLVPYITVAKTSFDDLEAAINRIGSGIQPPEIEQLSVSSRAEVYSFIVNDIAYTIKLIGTNRLTSGSTIGIKSKELTPFKLGLAGVQLTKDELVAAAKEAITTKIKDGVMQRALIALIDNASLNGGTKPIDSALAGAIAPHIKVISTDFGEILAPIMTMDDSGVAMFPASENEPLVDVILPGGNMSIKALSGSGTSFRVIADLFDQYEATQLGPDISDKERFQVLRQFHKDAPGKNVDKIIAAAKIANTLEYNALVDIIGTPVGSFDELTAALSAKNMAPIGPKGYGQFLATFLPMMTASGASRPLGLPADGYYYLGKSTKSAAKPGGMTGKPSYDKNPLKGGANIITYVLGKGLETMILKGVNSAEYSKLLNDIVGQSKSVLGHIVIHPDGKITMRVTPFSKTNFKFHYHAPSNLPGNNLPGFIVVLD